MTLTSYAEKAAEFNLVRARCLQIVKEQPGLTTEDIAKQFLSRWRHLPDVGRRLREAREWGWVYTEEDGSRVRWFLKTEE